ncbi:MAG: V-type ATP synthase subunit E [Dethiobacter sp.]|nr:V-type ATP synthase subunit E [Dethiobacter sp.]MBS3898441.1 V-type ATP synthase subunit E [Dethiobacter sp.]MBS3982695.1 V-type ATP synthase subunit E [Dethiobacter sp.]
MSGANKLKEKILAEAGSQAADVLAEARQKSSEILAKGEGEAAAKKINVLELAAVHAGERRSRAQTIAELDARKAILAAKGKMIEETFKQALNRLSLLDQKAYQEILFSMLLAAAQSGAEEVVVSQSDRGRFTPEFLARVNQALTQQGKKGNLTLSAETSEMQGGFILRSGDVEINNSFDSILGIQRDQLEPEVAAILFG